MRIRRLTPVIALALLSALNVGVTARRARECPRLSVSCASEPLRGGTPATFTANVEGAPADAKLTFNWVVSAGTISSGQGTSSVTVDTTGLPNQSSVTATVDVKGLPESCPAAASCTVAMSWIEDYHDKLDEYGNISFEDEKARLDNFAIELQNWPDGIGYIVAYDGRRTRRGAAFKRAERAKKYVTGFRHIPEARVVTVYGGYREELTSELRVRQKGAPPPVPFPTVDPSEVPPPKAALRRRARRR